MEQNNIITLPLDEVTRFNNQMEYLEERISELEFATEDRGWQRLGGSNDYELDILHLKQIVARARIFYLHNPLINRAVSLQADYVFAQGLNIVATDKKINPVIQRFIDDSGNQRELTGHQARLEKEQTLMLDGNVFLVLFTKKQDDGFVSVRSIILDEITDIITNPDDSNEVWYYRREWTSTPLSGGTVLNKRLYPDINYDPISKPAKVQDIDVDWNAPIYHVKVGALAKSRFGVPEVYCALDWADAHRNFLQDWATIVRMYARWALQLKVPGGKSAVAAAKTKLGDTISADNSINRNPATIAGGIFTTTKEGAELSVLKTSGATTSAQDGREIRMMVAAALGIPDTFFGDVDVGNLATARTLDRPTELKYRSRQQLWMAVYANILNYVVRWSILAPNGPLKSLASTQLGRDGRLTIEGQENLDTHIEVMFPPILEHSIKDRIDAVTEAVTLNGKTFAVDSPELQQLTIRLMLQALGIPDVDEIVKRIFDSIVVPEPQPEPGDNTDGSSGPGTNSDVQPTGTKEPSNNAQ